MAESPSSYSKLGKYGKLQTISADVYKLSEHREIPEKRPPPCFSSRQQVPDLELYLNKSYLLIQYLFPLSMQSLRQFTIV